MIAPNATARTALVERDDAGRFVPGNQLARGHGSAHDLARWRRLALGATTEQDMLDVWGALVACAKAGEPWAVLAFLDRTCGKSIAIAREPEQGDGIGEALALQYRLLMTPTDREARPEAELARYRAAEAERQDASPDPLGRVLQPDSTRSTAT